MTKSISKSDIYSSKTWEKIFEPELAYITDVQVYNILMIILGMIPPTNKWKTAAAASTAKYHPICSLGIGGLIRHTKFVVQNIYELIRATPKLEEERSELIAAAILHDLMKYPTEDTIYSRPDHPTLMKKFIYDLIKEKRICFPDVKKAKVIARLISKHQGRAEWQKDKQGNLINKSPTRLDEWALHYADLLASRVYMNVDFDEDGNLILDTCVNRDEVIQEIKMANKKKEKVIKLKEI